MGLVSILFLVAGISFCLGMTSVIRGWFWESVNSALSSVFLLSFFSGLALFALQTGRFAS